jgi:LysR substrate binding domain
MTSPMPGAANVFASASMPVSATCTIEVADVVQLLHMITLGRMIAVLPRSLVEPAPAGLVCVPVTDAPPSRLVLAWNEQDRRPRETRVQQRPPSVHLSPQTMESAAGRPFIPSPHITTGQDLECGFRIRQTTLKTMISSEIF